MPDHSKTTPRDEAASSGEQLEVRPGTIWRRPASRAEVDLTLELTLSDVAGEPTSREGETTSRWPLGAARPNKKK